MDFTTEGEDAHTSMYVSSTSDDSIVLEYTKIKSISSIQSPYTIIDETQDLQL